MPPAALRGFELLLEAAVLLLAVERPGGLPRRAGLRVELEPRLVLVYWRGLLFVFCLGLRVFTVSLISWAL
jgi:hypothetical protein